MTMQQQNLITIGFITLCLAILISLAGIITYAVVRDGSAATQVLQVLQDIILEGIPAIGGLLGIHVYRNGGLVSAIPDAPSAPSSAAPASGQ